MLNRNFDSRVVIQRLRDKNLAQNFAQFQENGAQIINNPQTSDPSPQRIGQYYDRAGTAVVQNLLGGGYTVDLGATANFTPSTIPPSPPTSLSATAGDASLSVAFTAGNLGTGSLINYEYSIDGGVTFTAFSPAQTTSPVTISGLTNGTTYTVALKTVATSGTSTASATTTGTPVTTPDAPTITGITAGNQQLSVAFTAPASNGGSAITNYQYSTNNGSTFTSVSPAQTSSPIVITGLTNGTTYSVQLRAVNAVGSGTASATTTGTPVSPATAPGAPTSLIGTPGDSEVSISFTAPASDGGSPITNYQYSTNNGVSYTAVSPAQTTSPIVITGLTNGTSYTVRLKAVNAIGAGTASSSISVTPAGTPPAPSALSGVGGDQAIYVLFTQSSNGGSAITNYEYSVDNGATFTAFSPAQTFSPVMISGLTNGTAYDVLLKAVNTTGTGPASTSISVTPTTNTLLSASRLINLDATNSSSYSGSGTAWTNLDSGGSYSATLQNGPIYDTSTPTNKYFTFNGTNQIAEIAAAAAINPTTAQSFTAQIWARVDTSSPNFTGGDGLISKQFGAGSYDGYALLVYPNTSVELTMNGASVNGRYPSSTGVYNNGWALYTIVVDFGGGSESPSYTYVSTRRVISANNNESGMPSQAPLQFPRGIQDSGSNFCPADVGAFYLYNTILTQEQIIHNYDATKSRYGL